MTIASESRLVHRAVTVYRCNRCGAEALEDGINGWMHLCVLEVREVPNIYGTKDRVQVQRVGTEQHLCVTCCARTLAVVADKPPAVMVGADAATFEVRTNDGGTILLTRFEYERWSAQGKPPILCAAAVKA